MISNLQPYPKYIDSGVEWLGKVPEGWEVLPNRTLFQEIKDSNHPEEPLVSVTISRGIIKQSDLIDNTSKKDSSNEDKTKYKLVQPGDIAYNKMRAWQGAIGVSNLRGIVSPAYIIQRPRKKLQHGYFHNLLRTPLFAKEAERWSYGITSDQWSLRSEHFKMIYCSLPPIEEQTAIVRYLNYINNRIQRYIIAKQKLIKLLEEQKQVTIHQAVTGAIDVRTGKPYPKYKVSSVEWLSQIPEGWKINRMKYAAQVNPPTNSIQINEHEKIEFVPMENVDEKVGIITSYELRPFNEVSRGYTTFMSGDIIFAKITPCMENGNCAIVGNLRHGIAFGSTEFIVFRVKQNKIATKFLHLILRDKYLRSICEVHMKGSAGQKRISPDFLSGYKIAFPTIADQEKIVEFIQNHFIHLDKTLIQIKNEIELLQEYRTRLTADVVTGKVDVRKAAKNLPAEITDSIVNDPNNDDIEVNEMLDEITEE